MRTLFLPLTLAWQLTAAEDPGAVSHKIVKLEFENEQVRILRLRYGPREVLPMHSYPQRGVVLLTNRWSGERMPHGKYGDGEGRGGEFLWEDAMNPTVGNLPDEPVEAIEIEMKTATAPSVPVLAAPQPAKSALPVPVPEEPRHHWRFENQYVRVFDAALAPGETTLLHTHSHDGIAVYLSDAGVQEQELGKQWGPSTTVRQGQVDPPEGEGAKLPLTHRVRNVGATVFHVIFIELLQ